MLEARNTLVGKIRGVCGDRDRQHAPGARIARVGSDLFSSRGQCQQPARSAHQRRDGAHRHVVLVSGRTTTSPRRCSAASRPACRCDSSATAARSSKSIRPREMSSTALRRRACPSACATTRRGTRRSITGRPRSSPDRTSSRFGSANYTPYELAPFSSTNYDDETALFTTDPTLRRRVHDEVRSPTGTTRRFEPESLIGAPPYLKDWNAACATESACATTTRTIRTRRRW